MNMIASRTLFQDREFPGTLTTANQGVVAVVSDDIGTIQRLASVCDFLDLKMEVVPADIDLDHVLREQRPMAVIADVDCLNQDGFYTMKQVARHDRDLPILLLTDGDPALMGAADAVQEMLGLTAVTNTSGFPLAGQLVAFLFAAGRQTGCMRMVPV